MNIRSIVITVIVLVVFVIGGPAQDWMFPVADPKANSVAAIDPKPDQAVAMDPKPNAAPVKEPKADLALAKGPKADPAPAQDWTQSSRNWAQNLYANIDFGGVYQQENTTLFQSAPFPTSSTATFNLGLRGNVALGYNINKQWAVELASGVLWNSMDKVNGIPLDQPYPLNVTFDTYTVPLLVNVVFKYPLSKSLVPYVGIGVGGTASFLSYTQASSSMENCDFEFAYQAEAGLKYKISKRASLGIAYQFLSMTDPSWSSDLSVGGLPAMEYKFKEKGFYTHSFVISFAWNF